MTTLFYNALFLEGANALGRWILNQVEDHTRCYLITPCFFRVLIPCALTLSVTFLPSITTVLVCKLGFQTFLVWRWEKLTLWPNCLPLPVTSHFCIERNCICFNAISQRSCDRSDLSQNKNYKAKLQDFSYFCGKVGPITLSAQLALLY